MSRLGEKERKNHRRHNNRNDWKGESAEEERRRRRILHCQKWRIRLSNLASKWKQNEKKWNVFPNSMCATLGVTSSQSNKHLRRFQYQFYHVCGCGWIWLDTARRTRTSIRNQADLNRYITSNSLEALISDWIIKKRGYHALQNFNFHIDRGLDVDVHPQIGSDKIGLMSYRLKAQGKER